VGNPLLGPCKFETSSFGFKDVPIIDNLNLAKVSSLLLVDLKAQDVHYFQMFFVCMDLWAFAEGKANMKQLKCPHSASLFSGKRSF